MDSPERIWQLMARALNHEASPQEEDELLGLLRENQSLQQQYDLLTHIWTEKEDKKNDEEDARRHILKIIDRAKTETGRKAIYMARRKRRRFVAGISFVILLLLVTVTSRLLLHSSSRVAAGDPEDEVLVAKNGSRIRSLLPDGTTVWLNAGSRLFLENDFAGSREVRLEGEAFFDVVKKDGHPFIVHTSGIDIRVLGTAFNVKAYPGDKTVETTLLRGHVQVFDQQDHRKTPIDLRPNEKLVLPIKAATHTSALSEKDKPAPTKELPLFTITRIDSTKKEDERFETAWVYSRLEFRGDSFTELAQKLQRWYNVRIVFTDENVKQLSFNGSFEKESVEEAFVALKAANAFDYKIVNHEIFVGSSE